MLFFYLIVPGTFFQAEGLGVVASLYTQHCASLNYYSFKLVASKQGISGYITPFSSEEREILNTVNNNLDPRLYLDSQNLGEIL